MAERGRGKANGANAVSGPLRKGRVILAGLAVLVTAAASQTDPPRALASNGAVVTMPEISGLTCAEMAQVLYRIDLSNYRGPDPLPRDHPDWVIFDYEDRLTRRHYYDCMLGDHQLQDPANAFSFGFGTQ